MMLGLQDKGHNNNVDDDGDDDGDVDDDILATNQPHPLHPGVGLEQPFLSSVSPSPQSCFPICSTELNTTYYARYNDTSDSKMLPQNNDNDYDTDDDCHDNYDDYHDDNDDGTAIIANIIGNRSFAVR